MYLLKNNVTKVFANTNVAHNGVWRVKCHFLQYQ